MTNQGKMMPPKEQNKALTTDPKEVETHKLPDKECKISFFKYILIIYLFEREHKQRVWEREKQTPLSRGPGVGLNPRTNLKT